MQASYKYHIGQRFWVPRVTKITDIETVEVDGKEYSRNIVKYYPIVKEKEITEVTIVLSKNEAHIEYGIVSVEDPEDWPRFIHEDEINCLTKEEAERDAAAAAADGRECYDY
jgi:hypothetical protein